ncbi:MAG: radical SAM protein [Candidatus Jordarchaeales archaeon]
MRYPDWLAYATAVIEEAGYNVKLVDGAAEGSTHLDMHNLAASLNPDVTILDVTTPSFYNDVRVAKIFKENGSLVVAVGPHVSALPEESLKESNGAFDVIARREYDYTVLDIIQHFEDGKGFEGVNGVTYMEGNKIKSTPDRPFIENLDALPFPAWHHLNFKNYYNAGYLNPYLDIIGGRGCPFKCTFCLWPQVMHGRKYRFRSPQNIVDEMEYDITTWPKTRELFFEDDTFTVNHKRAYQICKEIISRKIDVVWSCNSRCDVLDLKLLKYMKRAGCRMLLVGPESGSQRVLNNVKKGITLDEIRKFAELAKMAGLELHTCWVIGLPGETRHTIELTIRFSKELDTEQLQVSGAVPFPGTEFYEWAKKNGYLKAKKWSDWLDPYGEQTPVIEYPWLSAREIREACDRLLREYYFRPKQIIKLVLKTRDLADLGRKVNGVLKLIDYFVKKSVRSGLRG